MNNLYRDLAPITEAAWAEIETEAARTFKRHIAGRRVVDVSEPGGPVTALDQHRAPVPVLHVGSLGRPDAVGLRAQHAVQRGVEQAEAVVRRAGERLGGVLGMRHQADDASVG